MIWWLIWISTLGAGRQHTTNVQMAITVNGSALTPNKGYIINNWSDSVHFTTVRFYLSNIILLNKEKEVGQAVQQYILVDILDINSLHFTIPYKDTFDAIQFTLGVDSAQQIKGAAGDDLDPMHGMYWTWQSGYINAKIEGNCADCGNADNSFQLHIGGYRYPYATEQTIQLSCAGSASMQLQFSVDKMLEKIQCSEYHHIMQPGDAARQLSEFMAGAFSIQ